MRGRVLAGVVAVALVVATACAVERVPTGGAPATTARPATTSTTFLPPPTAAPGSQVEPLAWERCGDLACATLVVPLDHDDPAGPTTGLAVARRPAGDPGARLGALVVNPGGPGSSGVELAGRDLFDGELADRFDVVGWDPRGVGGSGAVACDGPGAAFRELDPGPDAPGERAELDDAARALAGACAAAAGPLAAHVDAATTARDLDLLRQALGEDQLSFLGFSYGSLLFQEYARLFPARVRALVLDGVVDPAEALPEILAGQAAAAEATLAEVDGLVERYDRLAARVEARPLPNGGGPPVGPARLALAAIAATYDSWGLATLAEALVQGERGDGTALARLADRYLANMTTYGAYLAVSCTDSASPRGVEGWHALAAEIEAVAPRLGASVAAELLPCAWWPVPPTRQAAPVAPAGLVPALVVANTGDVATPYDDAVRVAGRLPGAVLLTVERRGHTAVGSDGCAHEVATRYLVDLALPAPGTTC